MGSWRRVEGGAVFCFVSFRVGQYFPSIQYASSLSVFGLLTAAKSYDCFLFVCHAMRKSKYTPVGD